MIETAILIALNIIALFAAGFGAFFLLLSLNIVRVDEEY